MYDENGFVVHSDVENDGPRWRYAVATLFFRMDGVIQNDDWLVRKLNDGYEIVRVDALESSSVNARMRPALVYILRKRMHNGK